MPDVNMGGSNEAWCCASGLWMWSWPPCWLCTLRSQLPVTDFGSCITLSFNSYRFLYITFVSMESGVVACSLSFMSLPVWRNCVCMSPKCCAVTNKSFFCVLLTSPCFVIQTQIHLQTLKQLACSVRISENTTEECVK